MAEEEHDKPVLRRSLGLWDLALLNIAAIVGLRWLSTAAQMGPSSLLLWVLALVVFFIPSGLAVMELHSRLPGEGGIYRWTQRAFGNTHGFLAGWAYWVNNLMYFPSLLLFLAGSFLFIGGEAWQPLADRPLYNAAFALTVLWIAIGLNIVGLQRGKWLQNIGGIGVWVIMVALLACAVWAWVRFGSATSITVSNVIPRWEGLPTLTFFATMTFAFAGLELGPVMGSEIKDSRRNIPRATLISGIGIASVYILGTAALLVAIPAAEVDVISGLPQAVSSLTDRLSIPLLGILVAALIVLSGIGGLSAWMTGTARIPFVVGLDRYLPKALGRVHPKWGSPHIALLTQGVLVTVLLLAAVVGSTVEEAYIVLLDMSILLYFIPYLYLFAALPVLRARKTGSGEGALSLVPGGRIGVWVVALLGGSAVLLSIVLACMPPPETERPGLFVLKVLGGSVAFLAVGMISYWRKRKD